MPRPPLAFDTTAAHSAVMPHLLFCGGFHSSMAGNKATALKALATQHGWGFTRFDYRGHGATRGDATTLTLDHWLEDTIQMIDMLLDSPGREAPPRLLLVGSSMGAWLAVLAALERRQHVIALLLIAAAPDFITELLHPALDAVQREQLSRGETVWRATPYDRGGWPISAALIDSGRRHAVLSHDSLATLTVPVRLIHGTADEDVPWSLSLRLMQGLGDIDATLELVHGADHRLSDPQSMRLVERRLTELVAQLAPH